MARDGSSQRRRSDAMSFWQRLEEPAHVVVCGASWGIGLALTTQLLARDDVAGVWAIARQASQAPGLMEMTAQYGQRLHYLDVDVCDEQALSELAAQLRAAGRRGKGREGFGADQSCGAAGDLSAQQLCTDPAAQAPVAAATRSACLHGGGAVGAGRFDWRQSPRRLVQLPRQQSRTEPVAAHCKHRVEPP